MTWEDIKEVKPKMITLFVATILYVKNNYKADEAH